MEQFENIRKAFSEQGTRFDYLFDVLSGLDCGIGKAIKGCNETEYIREKLRYLQFACDMIQHDTCVFLLRKELISEAEFDKFKQSLK